MHTCGEVISHKLFAAEDEVAAEVALTDDLVFSQLFRCTLKEYSTLKQQIRAISDAQSLGRVMVGDEDADILFFKFVDNRLDILYSDGVDAGKGLVEHDEFGVNCETTGNLGASAFAAGKAVAKVVAHFLKIELRYETLKFVALVFARGVSHLEDGADVVLDRQFAENGRLLREIADAVLCAAINRILGDVEVIEEDTALVRLYQTDGHIECRSLACSVRPEQSDNLTLSDINRNMVDNRAFTVFFDKIISA